MNFARPYRTGFGYQVEEREKGRRLDGAVDEVPVTGVCGRPWDCRPGMVGSFSLDRRVGEDRPLVSAVAFLGRR